MILEGKRNYLKADEVKNGDVIKILSEGEWTESRKFTNQDGSAKQQFTIKVEFDGAEKDFTLNATNRKVLVKAWGKETLEWVGKECKVEAIKMNVGGEIKNVILVNP